MTTQSLIEKIFVFLRVSPVNDWKNIEFKNS